VVREIDTEHLGNERVTCCWQVGDVLVDPGPESTLATLMDEIEDRAPRALLLTHIHLDHAGGTGALVRAFPDLPVYVHELGAPHLIDPSKLLPSAARLYGEENMDRMWGEIVPVPERNIRLLRGGETVEGFRVAYAPGHASHHVVYLHEDSGWVFTGDVAGVRIHREWPVVPPTPPPDIDVEAWLQSIDAIEAWDPAARWAAMKQLGSLLAETCPIIPLTAPDPYGLVSRRVSGVAVRAGWIALPALSLPPTQVD